MIYLFFNKIKVKEPEFQGKDLSFAIIVPTCNEEGLIASKTDNLKSLSHKNREVVFADSSDDRTPQIISAGIRDMPGFRLIRCLRKGRSSQINEALADIKSDLVMITDCDGSIASDTLEKACGYFSDESLGVLGACVLPETGYPLDLAFWKTQNSLRFLETCNGHSSTVSGVCYIFRRSILQKFPDSVWSDDIFVPFFANTEGYGVVYAKDIRAFELRSPGSFSDLWAHKVRKAQDNIKETARFLPQVKNMDWKWRLMFLTRAMQITALPFFIIVFICLFLSRSASVMILSSVLLILSAGAQLLIFKKLDSGQDGRINPFCSIGLFFLTNSIVFAAVLKYVSGSGRISYSKVK